MSKTLSQEEANMAVAVALQRNVADLEREIESLKAQLAECQDKWLEEAARVVDDRGKYIGGAVDPDLTSAAIRSLKGDKK